MRNPFVAPEKSRAELIANTLVKSNKGDYLGRSIVYVFFTRFCGVGCPFCFFKSKPATEPPTISDEFNDVGVDRFIEFCNKANVGYLAISGGGEPLNHRVAVLRSLAEIKVDRIVMNTSGSWAMNENAARRYLKQMDEAIQKRKTPTHVVVRLSVSEGHSIKLGIRPAQTLIKLFQSEFRDHPYLEFQLHGFRNDSALAKIQEAFPGSQYIDWSTSRVSADPSLLKVMPGRCTFRLADGYSITTGLTRVFFSDLRPNLHDDADAKKRAAIFMEDLEHSENFFPTVVQNNDGSKGIDWAINYNGNVCAWTNQVNDNQLNIYEDDYDKVLNTTFSDPLSLAILEKGTQYRDSITAEADPLAVKRLRAISLRDFSGTVIFEEVKTRLYFTLRVLQDYYQEGRLVTEAFEKLDRDLQSLIKGNKETLLKMYREVHYTIVDQYEKNPNFGEVEWRDLLELIKLGHYNLSDGDVQRAFQHYNSCTTGKKYESLKELELQTGSIDRRLTDRLMYIKPTSRFVESSASKAIKPETSSKNLLSLVGSHG